MLPLTPPHPASRPLGWGPVFRAVLFDRERAGVLTDPIRRAELHVSVRDTSESDPGSNPNLRSSLAMCHPQYSPLGSLLRLGEILLTQDEWGHVASTPGDLGP